LLDYRHHFFAGWAVDRLLVTGSASAIRLRDIKDYNQKHRK
jgi:hypothetical protein